MKLDSMSVSDAVVIMNTAFSVNQSFRFYPRGVSMLPLIREGKDSVSLVAPDKKRPLRIGDVILYKTENEKYILHRIVKTDEKKNLIITRGDAHIDQDLPTSPDRVLAVMQGFWRGDIYVDCQNKKYRRYVRSRFYSVRPRRIKRFLYNRFFKRA